MMYNKRYQVNCILVPIGLTYLVLMQVVRCNFDQFLFSEKVQRSKRLTINISAFNVSLLFELL
jgi:hypothetical protein